MVGISCDCRGQPPGSVGLPTVPDDLPGNDAAAQSCHEIAYGRKVLICVTHNSASSAPVDSYLSFRQRASVAPSPNPRAAIGYLSNCLFVADTGRPLPPSVPRGRTGWSESGGGIC